MKRRTVKTILCAALLTLAMTATACGGSDDAANGTDAATEEAAPAEEEAPAEETAPAEEEVPAKEEAPEETGNSGVTLEDYLKGDAESEKQLEEQAKSMENENLTMEIEVNGNELVYVATLKEEIEDPDAMAETLNEAVGPTFSALAGMLDEVVEAEKGTVSIGIRYCAPDGSVLAESSFRAE